MNRDLKQHWFSTAVNRLLSFRPLSPSRRLRRSPWSVFERRESRSLLTGDFFFASGFGGTSNDSGAGIATDSAGNVYTTGSFQGTEDFDPGPGIFDLVSNPRTNTTDDFVSKAEGNVISVFASVALLLTPEVFCARWLVSAIPLARCRARMPAGNKPFIAYCQASSSCSKDVALTRSEVPNPSVKKL